MEHDFDTLHGSILLKPNDGVNRASEPHRRPADGCFGAFAHTLGDCCVMCVKDYFHF
jgi:hypothetical protein